MTTREEQRYCEAFTAGDYRGEGEIVDLGCWLGSTTIPLARGLRRNSRVATGQRIHAFDLFIWDEWMAPYALGCAKRYRPGDSFLPEYTERTKPFADLIRIYSGDLQQFHWNHRPIEFLLVDAMKDWGLASHIVRTFYPHLIPGRALVFHQDYKHFYTPWIHLIQFRLKDYFVLEADLPGSCTTIFRLTRKIDLPLTWVDELKNLSDAEVDAAFSYSFSLFRSPPPNVAAAKVMYYIHLGRIDSAKLILVEFQRQGLSLDGDLGKCSELLKVKTSVTV